MFDGQNLPMRPAYFVPLYLLISFGGGILGTIRFDWEFPFLVAIIFLHGTWTLQATLYALQSGYDEVQIVNRARNLKRLAVVVAILYMTMIGLVWSFGEQGQNSVELDGPMALLVVSGIFSCFAFLWISARTIAKAETTPGKDLTASTLGTFIMLLYLFIGAFFVYRRLKRLKITA